MNPYKKCEVMSGSAEYELLEEWCSHLGYLFTKNHAISSWLLLCGLLFYLGVAHGVDLDYSTGYELEYSDNIDREPDDEDTEYTHRLGVDFALEQVGSRLSASAAGSIDYEYFAENTSSDRISPALDAEATAVIRPNALEWKAENHTRQITIDSTEPDTPNNTQTTNVFITGPDLIFRIDSINDLVAAARYGRYYFEDRADDSSRYLGALRWRRAGRTVSSSLNLDYADVDFDDDFSIDFQKWDLYAAGEWIRARNTTLVNIGGTTVDRDDASSVNGFLFRSLLTRALSANSDLGMSANIETTDSGTLIPATGRTRLDTSIGEIDTDDVVESKRAELTYTHRGSAWSQGLRAYAYKLNYEEDPNSRRVLGGVADIGKLLSATTEVTLSVSYADTSWDELNRDDTDKSAELRATYFSTRNLRFFIGGGWYKRSSDDRAQRYTENRANIGFIYGFLD